jgi:hypothetical protein
MMTMRVSKNWTDDERILVATSLLGIIQKDIPLGRYSEIGRPNITSVLSVLHKEEKVLEANRPDLVRMLGELAEIELVEACSCETLSLLG